MVPSSTAPGPRIINPVAAAGYAALCALPTTDLPGNHTAQIGALLTDITAGTLPLTAGDEARRTIELLTAIYKSAFTGESVARGSIGPGDPFYTAFHGGRSLAPRP